MASPHLEAVLICLEKEVAVQYIMVAKFSHRSNLVAHIYSVQYQMKKNSLLSSFFLYHSLLRISLLS